MAPWFTTGPSKRSTPHRPVGDIGVHINDPVPPSSSSKHYPSGDNGLDDDGSMAFGHVDSLNSVDQEESVPVIMHSGNSFHSCSGRPVGVTTPRPLLFHERRWDVNFTNQREDDYLLFAPLPHPNDSVDDSPHNSPRGYGEAFVGDHFVDMSPYCISTRKYDDRGAPSPSPTSDWSPGLELPTSPAQIGVEFQQRRQERIRPIHRIAPNMVEDEMGHLDMCWAAREAPPLVLPEPSGAIEREQSSPMNRDSSSSQGAIFLMPVPHVENLETDHISTPRGSPPVRSPVRERSPERVPEALDYSSEQRQAPQTATAMKNSSRGWSGKKLQKQVSFSMGTATYDVVPYSEVYGDHPKNFNFDSDGNMVSNASLIQEWGFQANMFATQASMFGNEGRMFDEYNRRYRMDDHLHDTEDHLF